MYITAILLNWIIKKNKKNKTRVENDSRLRSIDFSENIMRLIFYLFIKHTKNRKKKKTEQHLLLMSSPLSKYLWCERKQIKYAQHFDE